MATASNSTPNPCLIFSIHGPALGSSQPAPTPHAIKMTPIPRAIENIMAPPNTGSLLAIATPSAEISSGDTHAPTINAATRPSPNVPASDPRCRPWVVC